MALNFPNAPVEGQVYTAEGVTFVWTSGQWVVTFPWASNSEALAGTRADVAMAPLTHHRKKLSARRDGGCAR